MENEMTAGGGLAMSKVSAQVYTDMQALIQTASHGNAMRVVTPGSLPSHRNSHR